MALYRTDIHNSQKEVGRKSFWTVESYLVVRINDGKPAN